MPSKKPPERLCAACRQNRPKPEMTRIVLNKDGEISVDETGKAHGRGAYICPDCVGSAEKSKALERSFKQAVGKEIYAAVGNAFGVPKQHK